MTHSDIAELQARIFHNALELARQNLKGLSREELLDKQECVRKSALGKLPSHDIIAELEVLNELLKI